jgi:hypothetical protein
MTNKPTANELRALVAELTPRSPQEIMGAAASSNLMASMLTAALTGLGILLCATLLMFSLGFDPNTQADSTKLDTANSGTENSGTGQAPEITNTATGPETEDAADQQSAQGDTNVNAKANTIPDKGSEPQSANAIEAMGIGETADPDSKPDTLENRLDRILEGLE